MALVVKDRVQETGTANTTTSFTLAGAVTGYQSFSVIGDTNTTYYAATDTAGNWEAGLGTYSTTGPTLTRTTILSSSNSGSAVTFSGTVNVFVTYPSERALYLDGTSANINVSQAAFTANGIPYASSTTALATGSTLTYTATGLGINQSTPAARLQIGNTALSAASWTTSGIGLRIDAATYTDSSSTGTVAHEAIHSIAQPTLSSSSATTFTNASSLYIANAPAAGINVTITNPYSLYIAAGASYFGGSVTGRINPRVVTATNTATLEANISTADQYNLTAQTGTLSVSAPIGSPKDGNKLIFRILGSTTAQNISWASGTNGFLAIGVTLPTTTVVGKVIYVGCIYNESATRWDVVAVTIQT
jgi:hypothetical protein